MAISPSGRSDVYWVDGKLQIGDDCCASSTTRGSSSSSIPHQANPSYKLSDCRRCVLRHGKNGSSVIDIREYRVRDKWGSEHPTKVGVLFSVDEYKKLKAAAGQIDSDLSTVEKEDSGQDENIVCSFPLSEKHLLRTGSFKDAKGHVSIGVDLRETKATSSVKLSDKGICLTITEWNILKDKFVNIDKNIYQLC